MQKNSFFGDSKDFETGTWMLKKKHHCKYHCARLCETFDNRLLLALTESTGATNNNALSIIINNNNDNNISFSIDSIKFDFKKSQGSI